MQLHNAIRNLTTQRNTAQLSATQVTAPKLTRHKKSNATQHKATHYTITHTSQHTHDQHHTTGTHTRTHANAHAYAHTNSRAGKHAHKHTANNKISLGEIAPQGVDSRVWLARVPGSYSKEKIYRDFSRFGVIVGPGDYVNVGAGLEAGPAELEVEVINEEAFHLRCLDRREAGDGGEERGRGEGLGRLHLSHQHQHRHEHAGDVEADSGGHEDVMDLKAPEAHLSGVEITGTDLRGGKTVMIHFSTTEEAVACCTFFAQVLFLNLIITALKYRFNLVSIPPSTAFHRIYLLFISHVSIHPSTTFIVFPSSV